MASQINCINIEKKCLHIYISTINRLPENMLSKILFLPKKKKLPVKGLIYYILIKCMDYVFVYNYFCFCHP